MPDWMPSWGTTALISVVTSLLTLIVAGRYIVGDVLTRIGARAGPSWYSVPGRGRPGLPSLPASMQTSTSEQSPS